MVDFGSICDELLRNDDVSVRGCSDYHQILISFIETLFDSDEYEALVTGNVNNNQQRQILNSTTKLDLQIGIRSED